MPSWQCAALRDCAAVPFHCGYEASPNRKPGCFLNLDHFRLRKLLLQPLSRKDMDGGEGFVH